MTEYASSDERQQAICMFKWDLSQYMKPMDLNFQWLSSDNVCFLILIKWEVNIFYPNTCNLEQSSKKLLCEWRSLLLISANHKIHHPVFM